MAYTKNTWQTGDTITADKLNHMEDGIAEGGSDGGTFVVNFTYDEQTQKYTADKTIQEIDTAAASGPVIGYMDSASIFVLNSVAPMQFTAVFVSGNTGVIGVLEVELDDETDEPTGFWTQNPYTFSVTNPVV